MAAFPSVRAQSCHETDARPVRGEHTILLAGNPNCGKSTLFNALTGARQHVGNWPGKTVEKKEGLWRDNGTRLRVIDLPGIYSLTAYSLEEVIARDAILDSRADLVVVTADASNLERNLYLVVQIIEMGAPVVLALNMWDMAQAAGLHINLERISGRLGIPVIPATLSQGVGLEQLKRAITRSIATRGADSEEHLIHYSQPMELAIAELSALIREQSELAKRYAPRWLSLKLLERDARLVERLGTESANVHLLEEADRLARGLSESGGEDVEMLIADQRYGWINRLVHESVYKTAAGPSVTEKIDRVVTHRWLGIPIFLLVMFMLFRVTSEIPRAYVGWLASVLSGPLARWVSSLAGLIGLGGTWLENLAVQGIISGVGGVLAFVPVLMALYLGLGLLEDSGYMARAAFVIDRLMHALGLHGKSFIPMIVGFGCSVPGIYATRTMENPRERILTGLLVPFMSCSARLPVYVLFTAVFFPRQAGIVIFGLYLGGIAAAILVGLLLNRTLFRGMPQAVLIMELPAYHRPIWRNIWRQTWERTSGFIRKAGTTILTCSMLVWLLMAIPVRGGGRFTEAPVQDSLFAVVSQAAAPVFAPLGFDSWQSAGSLLTGIVAKEVVVSTMAQAYAAQLNQAEVRDDSLLQDVGEIAIGFARATFDTARAIPLLIGIDLRADASVAKADSGLMVSIREGFAASGGGRGTLAALAFLAFVLLYTPCISALTVARHELGTRWMALTAVGQFVIAWMVGAVIFQAGLILIG